MVRNPLYPDLPILLVDDEGPTLRSLSAILLSNGMSNIVTIADGREALPTLARHGAALVLLDLIMPHVSGQELLEAMVREHPGVPVVIVTAMNDEETADDCLALGAVDYIVKPIEEHRLVSACRRAIETMGSRRKEAGLASAIVP